MEFKEKLKARALKEEISLSPKQLDQFELFYNMLIETNKSMNLTAITDEDEVIEKHFIDSLSCRRVMDMTKVKTCIDVGTGAGFPGIPLKIVYPEIQFVLVDSLNKRVGFLNEVKKALGLEGLEALHGRAEDFAKQTAYREQFDLCVSRAVANLSTLSEYCIPYIRVGGMFVSYKSGTVEDELKQSEKAVSLLGGKIEKTVKFQLPDTEIGRSFVKIKKISETRKKYPRKAGLPAKEQLS